MCIFKNKIPTTKMTIDEIRRAISEQLGNVENVVYLDSKYKAYPFEEYLRIIYEDDTDKKKYVSEYMDCDNMSISLFGYVRGNPKTSFLPFGMCFVVSDLGFHAINIFLDDDHDAYYVEPQDDSIWKCVNDKKYTPYFIMI